MQQRVDTANADVGAGDDVFSRIATAISSELGRRVGSPNAPIGSTRQNGIHSQERPPSIEPPRYQNDENREADGRRRQGRALDAAGHVYSDGGQYIGGLDWLADGKNHAGTVQGIVWRFVAGTRLMLNNPTMIRNGYFGMGFVWVAMVGFFVVGMIV